MKFRAMKKSFVVWLMSIFSPILIGILIICLLDISAMFVVLIFSFMILISIFIIWFGLDICSVLILDDDGVKLISLLKTQQIDWSKIRKTIIIKPQDSLHIEPKDKNKRMIYYALSLLSPGDQESIKKILQEKTNLRVKEIKASDFVFESDAFECF